MLANSAEATTSSTGLDPLITGAFLIAGTLLGGLISFLTARWLDSRARQREEQLRWVRDVREASAELVARSHDYEETALMIHKAHIRGDDPRVTLSTDRWELLVEAQRALERATTLTSLIAPDDVSTAAHEVLTRATELGKASGQNDDMSFDDIQYSYSEAFADFTDNPETPNRGRGRCIETSARRHAEKQFQLCRARYFARNCYADEGPVPLLSDHFGPPILPVDAAPASG